MRGADPLHCNRAGDSAVHLAAQSGCAQSLGLLLSARGAGGVGTVATSIVHGRHSVERCIDAPNDAGMAPMHIACLHGNLAAINALILQGAALDTPVLGVSRRAVAAAAVQHVRRGALGGAQGLTVGATPLHISAAAGDAAACIALLDAARRRGGRGPAAELRRTRNAAGLTPLVCALMAGHFGLARLLVQNGLSAGNESASARAARVGGALGPSARARLADLLHRVQLLIQLRALAAEKQVRRRKRRREKRRVNEWAEPALAVYGLTSDEAMAMGRGPDEPMTGPTGALLRSTWLAVTQPADITRCAKLLASPRSNLRDALNAFVRLLAPRQVPSPAPGMVTDSASDDEGAASSGSPGPSPRHSGAAGAIEHWLSRLSGGSVARHARHARRRVAAAYAARNSPRSRGLTRDRMGPLDTGSLGMSAARGLGSLARATHPRHTGGSLVLSTLLGRGSGAANSASQAEETAVLSSLLDYLVTKNPGPLLLPELRSEAQTRTANLGAATRAMLALEPDAAADDTSNDDASDVAPSLPECCICMDAVADTRIPACSHTLCMGCAVQLVATYVERPTCPFCRCDVDALEAAERTASAAAVAAKLGEPHTENAEKVAEPFSPSEHMAAVVGEN